MVYVKDALISVLTAPVLREFALFVNLVGGCNSMDSVGTLATI